MPNAVTVMIHVGPVAGPSGSSTTTATTTPTVNPPAAGAPVATWHPVSGSPVGSSPQTPSPTGEPGPSTVHHPLPGVNVPPSPIGHPVGTLPFTGLDVMLLLAAAALMVEVGWSALLGSRRVGQLRLIPVRTGGRRSWSE